MLAIWCMRLLSEVNVCGLWCDGVSWKKWKVIWDTRKDMGNVGLVHHYAACFQRGDLAGGERR